MRPSTRIATAATPTPIPARAPVERECGADECVGVTVTVDKEGDANDVLVGVVVVLALELYNDSAGIVLFVPRRKTPV